MNLALVRPRRHAAADRLRPRLRRVHGRASAGPTAPSSAARNDRVLRASTRPAARRRRLRRLRHRGRGASAPPDEQASGACALHARGDRAGDRATRARCAGARTPSTPATAWPSSPPPTSSSRGRSPTRFGVDALIATELERDAAGSRDRRIRGVPALPRGQGRARRAVAGATGPARCADFARISVCYSDSTNDLPLLERGQPSRWPPTPRPRWRRIARERGWRILQSLRMIKKFIDKLLGKTPRAEPACRWASASRWPQPITASTTRWSTNTRCAWCSTLQRGRPRGLHRRRRGARPAGRPAAEGLRRRHQRHARAGEGAVPPRLHHRPALSHRARGVRPRPRARGDRGLDLPRLPRRQPRPNRCSGNEKHHRRASWPARRTWSTPAAACCATTSGARRSKTPRGATSPSTRCTTTRRRRSWSTTTTASRTPRSRVLRMIGDPATRYREDPVRIIRVVRFAAKLGFEIEPKTAAPIARDGRRCWPTCRPRACSTR